ncbi:MAG: phosphoglucosamine mutase [Candidatus Micrarchaeota archaeon]|nr:phosphoglucosamine mutase [Candidatus Micrarchaeota archaeon]
MSKYFGTNGVRGKFEELNPLLTMKLAQAIGIYLNRGTVAGQLVPLTSSLDTVLGRFATTVLVGRDGRLTGDCLKYAVFSGLQSVGCKVIDLGMVSSPTAEFMVKKLSADGLIVITASHNPPEWNALKVVDGNGIAISREEGEKIEIMLDKIKTVSWDKVSSVESYFSATVDHTAAILASVDVAKTRKRAPKVIIDCGNAMASLIAPKLLQELGCSVISLNSTIDGHFPGRGSEPTKDSLVQLIDSVKLNNADLGMAWDGDGDRIVLIDDKGEFIVGDKVFALSVLFALKTKKGSVVTTVATSKAAEDIATKFGMKTYYTKIGAPYLCQELLERNAVIAGEEVGGVIWPEVSLAKDGFLTAAKMIELLAESGKKLSVILKEIPQYFNEKTKIAANDEQKMKIVRSILDYAKKNKFNFIDIDGVRINFDDSWVIVRASGTENYVRVFAEAKTQDKAKKLMEEYVKLAETFR